MPQYFLNDKDRDRILAALDKIDGESTAPHRYKPDDDPMAPEVYVGILPCGEKIDARTGDTPGVNKVCLYKMEGTAVAGAGPGEPSQTYKLVPVLDLADNQIRIDCYNIYAEDVTDGERYISLKRTKYGRWMNERPTGEAGHVLPPTNPIVPRENPCTGTCSWTWDEMGEAWIPGELNSSACSNPPGTTQAPDDPCSNANTQGNCSCCPSENSYSNTSTTAAPTTTTLDPDNYTCKCQYPDHCGNTDGEITETSCSVGEGTSDLECTTTTTGDPTSTTPGPCDCDTSTTLQACGAGCDWKAEPVWMGGGSWTWHSVSNDCAPRCPCAYPSTIPYCNTEHTDCVDIPPPQPPGDPSCGGNCHFVYSETYASWVLIDHDCSDLSWCYGGYQSWSCCTCPYPSHTGGDCENSSTSCEFPPQNSTTEDPCRPCYSTTTTQGPTTSSTTTSCDPCSACTYPDERCCYNWSSECDQWILIRDLCGGAEGSSCVPCDNIQDWPPPQYGGSGVTKCVPCGGASTTTADPCPEDAICDSGNANCGQCKWKWSCDCDPPAWVKITDPCPSDSTCPCAYPDYECSRSWDNWRACGSDTSIEVETTSPPACNQMYANYCLTGNTSTTIPPTTTTTTVEPTTTDTTVTTCDPTTTGPPTTTTTTTVCPTTTTTTATSTTSTSCNPAPDCEQPENYNFPCGNPPFDPSSWDTCCCHGACCVYATNVQEGCPKEEGELLNCVQNATVWSCGASGGLCCGGDGEDCDTYFLGKGFTCEDCPENGGSTTETTTTIAPATGACCWDHGEECEDGITYGACLLKDDSIEWREDEICASFTCPTSLQPDEGACCYLFGSCSVTDEEGCESLEGEYHADKRCDQVVCPTTLEPGDGACCYNYGECNVETEANCHARVWQDWSADQSCGEVTCPTTTTADPLGSCCYNYGTCTIELTESQCESQPNFSAWYSGQGCPPAVACETTAPPGCSGTCNWMWDGYTWTNTYDGCVVFGCSCIEPDPGPGGSPSTHTNDCVQ